MSDVLIAPHGYRRFHCSHCGNIIDVPIHCSSKGCDICTRFRRYRIRERIQYALQGLPSNQTLRWRHFTLTVKNGSDLGERLNHLIKSFRKLRHRKLWKSSQYGGFYVVEITERGNGWHPHLHIVSFGHYLNWRKLLYVWCQITKDSSHVMVSSIRGGSNIAGYISKYITKATVLSIPSLIIVDLVCKNRRLFGPFGAAAELMKNFKPPKKMAVCTQCHHKEWVPDIILEIMKRRSAAYF